MEKVAHDLAQILLRAVPTFVLVLLLYFFLKKVFFNPLQRILDRRYAESEGALKAARETAAAAERRAAEYQQALREARAEIHRMQEGERQRTVEECSEELRRAGVQADERLRTARDEIRAEADLARAQLAGQSAQLAEAISSSVLKQEAETAG
jgi:F-type H+-transporting ATPase subunit b